jgi:hypothetical protein
VTWQHQEKQGRNPILRYRNLMHSAKRKWQPPEEMPGPGGPAEIPEPAPEQAPPTQPEVPVTPETTPSPAPPEVPPDSGR